MVHSQDRKAEYLVASRLRMSATSDIFTTGFRSGENTASMSGDYATDLMTKTPEARQLCIELLRAVAEPLSASSASIYAPVGGGNLTLVGSSGTRESREANEHARKVAWESLRSNDLIVVPTSIDGSACESVAVPCAVAGDVAAVVVVQRPVLGKVILGLKTDENRLLALGLAVERYRMLLALEQVRAEADAVRRQLDAYAVDLRSTYIAEQNRSEELASALDELIATYESTVRGLAIAVEAKDEYTGGHLFRVSRYGMAITAVMAPEHIHDPQFEYGFLLHDVGKLVVPDAVLMKDGPLDEEEWEMMRAHPDAGRTILEQIPFLSVANEIVHSHHERWDGLGYPRGLKGEEIPLGARIFPLADVFDAMTTTRPYRKALSVDDARAEMQRGSGTQFCPEAVEAFLSIGIEELELVRVGDRPDRDA
ncbi:MAG: HD-GYP domain-containing protein [Acidimicrobiales bacterium]